MGFSGDEGVSQGDPPPRAASSSSSTALRDAVAMPGSWSMRAESAAPS